MINIIAYHKGVAEVANQTVMLILYLSTFKTLVQLFIIASIGNTSNNIARVNFHSQKKKKMLRRYRLAGG